ncbi:hypothetical protein [Saccharopolyspora hattusasensis]|uniref:hypothetical protein n=1 Tax=Saccharopolyspora hattusasensis TaxID=1128679 RepID=UPI003D98A4A7
MRQDEIQINLHGAHEAIDPRAVAEAIMAVDKILRGIASDSPASFSVSGLSVGSAHISVRGDHYRVATVNEGLTTLSASATIPAGWGIESVTGLVELEHVRLRRGVEGVGLRINEAITAIDGVLAEHARQSIAPPPPSLGSVRGKLYRYNNDAKRSAGLRDYRTGHVVDVHFPAHLTAEVRSALDHEVEVWGEVRRDVEDRVRSISIAGIEVFEESRVAVTLDDVAGILGPGWTGGLDPVEWVRRQRD